MRLASTSTCFIAVGMRISRALLLAAVLVLIAPLYSSFAQQDAEGGVVAANGNSNSPLDGLQFSAGIVRSSEADNGNEPLRDTLNFNDGQFSSVICQRYNFSSAPYWIRREDDQVHFLAELSSPTDGKMVWKGTIRDGKLEGTMRWTRKRWYWTVDVEHKIRGELNDSKDSNTTD